MKVLQGDGQRLGILVFLHFAIDFCCGLNVPLPEPTLMNHFSVGLGVVTLLVGGAALLVNVVQPVAAAVLPKRGLPLFLFICPIMASCYAYIGFTRSYAAAAVLMAAASIGVGLAHPEAVLAAHRLSGRRKGLGVSAFMAAGYLGFSCGSLLSGVWVNSIDPDLRFFWVLSLPVLMSAFLVYASGLHKLQGHVYEETAEESAGRLPTLLVLPMAVLIASSMTIIVRFTPIVFVRLFPDQNAQAWAGATVAATGLTGVAGAFIWGWLSDRFSRGWIIAAATVLAIPSFYGLLHINAIRYAPIFGLGIGITLGGIFPLSVVLVREAGGLSQRMRMALAIGGAWGTGELLFILGGQHIDSFPAGAVEPVQRMLSIAWIFIAVTAVLAVAVAIHERKALKSA